MGHHRPQEVPGVCVSRVSPLAPWPFPRSGYPLRPSCRPLGLSRAKKSAPSCAGAESPSPPAEGRRCRARGERSERGEHPPRADSCAGEPKELSMSRRRGAETPRHSPCTATSAQDCSLGSVSAVWTMAKVSPTGEQRSWTGFPMTPLPFYFWSDSGGASARA